MWRALIIVVDLFYYRPEKRVRRLTVAIMSHFAPGRRWPCPPAPAARAFPVGASPFRRPIGTSSHKSEILSAFCAISRLCKAENFPLGRDADTGFRATGVRRRPETTTVLIVSRPDAFPPRDMLDSAGRCARLVPAI
jgi:hypothetical protein